MYKNIFKYDGDIYYHYVRIPFCFFTCSLIRSWKSPVLTRKRSSTTCF